jgi:hypothetical protein
MNATDLLMIESVRTAYKLQNQNRNRCALWLEVLFIGFLLMRGF